MSHDPFVQWQRRLGGDGTHLLERLRTVLHRDRGLLADDLGRIAEELGWPVAAVAGAASFYADLAMRQRGWRHVQVCQGTSCFVSTAAAQTAAAEAALGVPCGQTSTDGSVSLAGVYCLGYCYASPALLDDNQPRAGADVGEMLRNPLPAPPVPYYSAVRQAVLLAGLTSVESPWQVWSNVIATGSAEQVRAEVAAAGLRGRGGAEYPVAAKWEAALLGPTPRYVVANGDEGDPGSFCDRLLMESDPHRVLAGLALAGFAVGARRGLVFVRSEYPIAAQWLRSAVAQARSAGHLGVDFDIDVIEGAGSYVAGEETALLHAVQGLRGSVRPVGLQIVFTGPDLGKRTWPTSCPA